MLPPKAWVVNTRGTFGDICVYQIPSALWMLQWKLRIMEPHNGFPVNQLLSRFCENVLIETSVLLFLEDSGISLAISCCSPSVLRIYVLFILKWYCKHLGINKSLVTLQLFSYLKSVCQFLRIKWHYITHLILLWPVFQCSYKVGGINWLIYSLIRFSLKNTWNWNNIKPVIGQTL